MTDEDIKKGQMAEDLLANDAFKDAESRLRKAIHDRWATSPVGDFDGQHELRLMLKLLDDLLGNLRVAAADGRFAKEDLQIKRGLVQNVKRALTNRG